jgi:hypothetical protein
VELYEVMGDGESEAQTAMLPCRCAVALNERFKDVRQQLLIDALAGIADADSNFRGIVFQRNLYNAVLRSELDSIAKQVRENLVETFPITQNFGRVLQVRLQLQGLRISREADGIQRIFNNSSQVDGFELD